MATRSVLFLSFVLCDSGLHELFDQRNREGLVRREVDGPLRGGKAFQFVLKGFNNCGCRKQAAVVRKRGEPYQHALVLKRGNPIADDLGGFRRRSRLNCRAKFGEGAAGWFRNAGKVFLDVFRSGFSFRCGTTADRFHFLHRGMLLPPLVQVHLPDYRADVWRQLGHACDWKCYS
jgi:hypothetical protein